MRPDIRVRRKPHIGTWHKTFHPSHRIHAGSKQKTAAPQKRPVVHAPGSYIHAARGRGALQPATALLLTQFTAIAVPVVCQRNLWAIAVMVMHREVKRHAQARR
jgi:hypothetical protein